SLKTSIKTITYLSDIGCLEIQGASLKINTDIQHEKETNTIVLVFSVVIPIDKNSMLNQHTDIQLTSGMAVTAGP
ncbi:hypothetical protein, partial [Escherichia coli]|uniref:hypothetical protein n=1 Tax=Escherichia coli TaxID=562 RepID=UPI001BC8597C